MVVEPQDSDRTLLDQHLAGDGEAFEELFLRHQDKLWAAAIRVTRNPEDASDALQEAMISAFRRAHTFRGDAAVSTWLYRITVNAALDRVAKRSRTQAASLEDEGVGALFPQSSGPDDFQRAEVSVEISKALAALSQDRRSVIVLVDVLGYSLSDAAEALNIPEGTIKSRLFRARSQLAEKLRHLDPGRDSKGEK